jgi:ankyrin repeat protein
MSNSADDSDVAAKEELLELCRAGDAVGLEELLRGQPGVDIEQRTTSLGRTGLWLAAHAGDLDCVRLLLEAGAKVNAPDADDYSPLAPACRGGFVECASLLIAHGADVHDPRIILMTAEVGFTDVMQLLIEKKADVDLPNPRRNSLWTPFLACASTNCIDGLKLLINTGRVDINGRHRDGWTGLMLAATGGHTKCVELLCEHKADLDACLPPTDITPILMAIEYRHRGCVWVLLEHGADPHTYSSPREDLIPLRNALDRLYGEIDWLIVWMLLYHGVDVGCVVPGADVGAELISRAKEDYNNIHSLIDEFHAKLKHTLFNCAEVDTRLGRGGKGIYQEPLERVLEYLGMSMNKDQIVNTSIDGEQVRRVLKRGDLRSAEQWYNRYHDGGARLVEAEEEEKSIQISSAAVKGDVAQVGEEEEEKSRRTGTLPLTSS